MKADPKAILHDENGNPLLGQGLMSAALPVTIASNQSAIPVSGPLTDAQLRATAVPVSGTVTTGGLTDAQLRATAVPVTNTTTSTIANGTQTAVGAAAVEVLAANANRKFAVIQNVGLQAVRIGAAGVTNTTGMRLAAGEKMIFTTPFIPTNAIFAIRETANSTVLAQEAT